MITERYDFVIIGGGPNGLGIAAYLSKSGYKVCICEERLQLGGGAENAEPIPGFRIDPHATYLYGAAAPIFEQLELWKFGFRMRYFATLSGAITSDGKAIIAGRFNREGTYESIKKYSPRDAEFLRIMQDTFKPYAKDFLRSIFWTPPYPPGQYDYDELPWFRFLKEKVPGALSLFPTEYMELSTYEILAPATYIPPLPPIEMVDPEETGMGFMVPLLVVRATQKCYTYGGSHRFASAMAREFCSLGGIILDNAEVEKIIVEGKKAVGVKLKDGRKIFAKVVASSLPAPITFEKLSQIPESAKEESQILNDWKWDKWSFFTLHFTSKSTPKLKPGRENPLSFMTIIGFSNLEDVMDFFRKLKEGKPEIRGGHFTCQSMFDDTLSRDGKVVSFLQVCFPYCDYKKEEIERELLKLCEEYFEFSQDEIASEGPKEIEMRLTSMVRGSIKHGDYTPTQMGYFRPTENSSSSATPVEGLYLCGASTYPGGLIIGGPGYIAANRVCDDLGVKKWWKPPDFILKFLKNYGDK